MGAQQSMDEIIFNLKLTNRQLEKFSKKATADEKKERLKVSKALKDKDGERARVYAENAIRKKNESLNYLRMASRIDAVTSRLQSAQSLKAITAQMGGVVKGLDKAMASMDLVALTNIMDKFESQFQDLDTRTAVMENSIAGATAMSTPLDQIEALMREVADENAMDVESQLTSMTVPTGVKPQAAISNDEDADLSRRLAALRS